MPHHSHIPDIVADEPDHPTLTHALTCAGVATYLGHLQLSPPSGLVADNAARWISSSHGAFVSLGQKVTKSAWQSVTFYRTFWVSPEKAGMVATLMLMADRLGSAYVNGQLANHTAVFPEQAEIRTALLPGRNLVTVQCNSTGSPPVVVASLLQPDGEVLLRTDHTWLWL